MQASNNPLRSHRVAVIGAGAAGLVVARELHLNGHQMVVFEKGDQLGGTWVYTAQVESDPIGLDPTRKIVHISLYQFLRVNLPRETMGFMDYPSVIRDGEERDLRRFPGHREVLMYLQDFAKEFGIEETVRDECEVLSVEMIDNGKWEVNSKRKRLCNSDGRHHDFLGRHYAQPRIAEIPGDSVSTADLSIELVGVAKEVHTASRSVTNDKHEKQPGYENMWRHSMVQTLTQVESRWEMAILGEFLDGVVVCAARCPDLKHVFIP